MKRSTKSRLWYKKHVADYYVNQSKENSYRSRSVYKLIELQNKYELFKKGMNILELGSYPGGWSQLLINKVGDNGCVFAIDDLIMKPLKNLRFMKYNLHDENIFPKLYSFLGFKKIDWVVSDLSPNKGVSKSCDQERSFILLKKVWEIVQKFLPENASFLTKAFHGVGFSSYVGDLRKNFRVVMVRKPKASRPASSEVYIIAMNKTSS